MDLMEFQAKELFAKHGVATTLGVVAETPEARQLLRTVFESKRDPREVLRELQKNPSVVALGEMGMDYFHKFADRATQRKFFEWQLSLAAELGRRVISHCREAVDDTLAIYDMSRLLLGMH